MLPMVSRPSSCRSVDGDCPLEENFLSCPVTDACVRSRDRSADITALVDGSIGPFPFSSLPPIPSVPTAAPTPLTPSAADGKCKPANHCAQRYGLHGTSEGNSKIPNADARAAWLWLLVGLGVSLPVSLGKRLTRRLRGKPDWGHAVMISRAGRYEKRTVKLLVSLPLEAPPPFLGRLPFNRLPFAALFPVKYYGTRTREDGQAWSEWARRGSL